ncbi:MAG TPA: C45 family peptidase [Patescibacteria group bacterium]|nr:C45 family peptidase [Patescibacteria group bacterium]
MKKKQFPYLEINGTHRDIGRAIGETFRNQITSRIDKRKQFIQNYNTYIQSTYPYFIATLKAFPQYIDEITGVAQGARISVTDYFFLNNPEVYPDIDDIDGGVIHEHCTTVVSRNESGLTIGHTEDWFSQGIDDLFVLKATVCGTTFLCLDYASFISGSSASLNSFGIAQCINDLHSHSGVGIPVYFAARGVLECRTLKDAENLLRRNRWASGFNHVLGQGRTISDIECTAQAVDASYIQSDIYAHTNHFLSPRMRQYESMRSESSVARYMRASSLVTSGMRFSDIQTIVSDTSNKQFPINKPDETIAAVIIEPTKRTLSVCRGRPSEGTFVSYTL